MRALLVLLHLSFLSLMVAAQGFAAPSFRVLVQNNFVGGTLSADGSRVGVQQASASASASIYDVARARSIAEFASADSIGMAISGDGSIAQITRGLSIAEYRNGVETPATRPPVFFPVALSNDGDVSAGNAISGNFNLAFRMTGGVDGTPEPLGDLPGGGTDTRAFALSGDGAIVVGYGTSDLGREAFRWDSGVLAGLGDLSGGVFQSEAMGISQDGSTIVGYGTSDFGRQAIRWRNGVMEVLADDFPTGSGGTIARAASGDGSTIVGSDDGAPFIWSEDLGMRDLRVVLTALGVDVSALEQQGLFFGDAIDVSSDGKTILGQGWRSRAFEPIQSVIWLAVIPEPSTALLIAIGLIGLSAVRRA